MLRRVVTNSIRVNNNAKRGLIRSYKTEVTANTISSNNSRSLTFNIRNNNNNNNNNESRYINKRTLYLTPQMKVNVYQKRSYASLPSGLSEMKMPALSPTMDKGTIVSWRVKEGDKIRPGDCVCEIETDKSKLEFEYQEEGYIAKILKPAGSKDIRIGETIAIVAESKEDISKAENISLDSLSTSAPKQATPASQPPQQQQAKREEATVVSSAGAANEKSGFIPEGITEIKMPALSPTMNKGNILKWNVKEGDKLSPGDVLCVVETDKSNIEFEFQDEGYLAKILKPEGSKDINLGEVIALLADSKESISAANQYRPGSPNAAQPAQKTAAAPPQQAPVQEIVTPIPKTSDRIFASPLAKKVAGEQGIDLSLIGRGSGENERIVKADVEEFIASGRAKQAVPQTFAAQVTATTQVAEAGYIDIPLSNIRKVIADRLLESKRTIPHYYLTVECELDALMKLRSTLNKAGESRGFKLSVNDFIIKAASLAMKKVPEVNSSWRDTYIRQFESVDVSVAVQTDNGLITPIVFSAEKKGLSEISNTVKSLAERARAGKLKPNEFQGGTFTISNLGMFGVSEFAAIINPPQACILAVGAAQKKVVSNDTKPSKEGEIAERYRVVTTMKVTLSCDHRVVDGAVGAQWLQEFKSYIENPEFLML
jgi:pyruvate dehydrogenase E2 component (dihydrolipoamide acetyltransferase)